MSISTEITSNISFGNRESKPVICLRHPNNILLNKEAKSLGAKWSNTLKCWIVPDNKHYRQLFDLPDLPLTGKAVIDKIHPENLTALNAFRDTLVLKGYSVNTQRTYLLEFAQLLYLLKTVKVETLDPLRLRSYFLYCHRELKMSESGIHSRLNAIKFYFEKVLHKEKFFFEIPRPKKPVLLPKLLSTAEIKKLFAACENKKHLLMLQLCYGMGLRVSEIVALKISHIDSGRMQVLISCAKGKKDRYVNLPATVLSLLRNYYKEYRPTEYLFEGQRGGAYSIRSVQSVFNQAMTRAKINKTVGIHGLRHSYATHLLEMGTDISLIQQLLGHNDIKTTLIYTHVSQKNLSAVVSPLDRI